MALCKGCGKITPKKYCSDRCQYEHDEGYRKKKIERARNYHLRMKDKPEYKKKAVARTKKWLSLPENRKKWNLQMREIIKVRMRRLRKEWKEKGLCRRCGRDIEQKGYSSCNKCLNHYREKYRKSK